MKDLHSLDRFFNGPFSSLPLGVFRSVHGLIGLANALFWMPDLLTWFGADGLAPQPVAAVEFFRNLNLFHLIGASVTSIVVVFVVHVAASLGLIFGLFSRTSAFLFFVTLVSFHHRNLYILSSGDTLTRLMSFFLILTPCGAAFSLDRLLRIMRRDESPQGWPQVSAPAVPVMRLQVSLVYLATGIWKATGTAWWGGSALFMVHQLEQFERFPVPGFMKDLWFTQIASGATLAIELFAPFLLWVKQTRVAVLLVLLALHLGIEYSLNIQLFQPIMISGLLLFVRQDELLWISRKIKSVLEPIIPAPMTVVIDGDCGFCRRSAAVLRCLDVFSRLTFYLNSDPELSSRFTGYDFSRSQREVLSIAATGTWRGGFSSFHDISKRLPLLWGFAALAYLPGSTIIGNAAYRWVADNRLRISAAFGLNSSCSMGQ